MRSLWSCSTNTVSLFNPPTTGSASAGARVCRSGFHSCHRGLSPAALIFVLTFFSGCDNRFISKEINPLFNKEPEVISLSGRQQNMMDELQENRKKIQALKKEQAALLNANRKLFKQLEFVGAKAADMRTANLAAARWSARPRTIFPPEKRRYSEFDLNGMGVEAFTSGNYDLALAHFNTATAINPKFYEAFTNMGVVHMTLGQYQQAVVDFNKALKINPNFKAATNYLQQAEASLKKQAIAVKKKDIP
ncbi:MAG: tetratricopeptide repeat protein [Nitrospinales bacterium]